MSEVGFLVTKKCRQCGHPLSLHSGRTHLTQSNREWAETPSPPTGSPAPRAPIAATLPSEHGLADAAAGLTDQDLSPHRDGLNGLQYLLVDDEQAVLLSTGSFIPAGKFMPVNALVVLTDKRVIVYRSRGEVGPLAWCDARDPGLRLELKEGFLVDSLRAAMPDGQEFQFSTISRNARQLNAALGNVRHELSRPVERAPEIRQSIDDAPAAAGSDVDPLSRLQRLGELHQAGILTDEEFAAQKAKLLGQL
ncbi:SHOCT domain-containing protein [Propioniciclava soli]|uniref:SHOCT domain-containing protein n=1 Tax=Propioniciclava soli TaxID=2775081 RepID=A0ABZ3C8L8_9ACTN